ncbi:MAG: hypothetical protein IID44_25885 [Planctomycetes bacterium]|nr:hypothetical protein [Planctomycetota bacterium]
MRLQVLGNLLLNFLLPGEVNFVLVFFSRRAAGQIEIPTFEKGVAFCVEQASADVFSEDAAIFILLHEMLPEARTELPVARVCANPDNSIRPMGSFPILKQDVDTVLRNRFRLEWKMMLPKLIEPFVDRAARITQLDSPFCRLHRLTDRKSSKRKSQFDVGSCEG